MCVWYVFIGMGVSRKTEVKFKLFLKDLEQEMRKTTVVSKIGIFVPTNLHLVEDAITENQASS